MKKRNEDELVPILEIADGWTTEDLETVEECDDALLVVEEDIAAIEGQLENEKRKRKDPSYTPNEAWEYRARQALKYKTVLKNRVVKIRAELKRNDATERALASHKRLLSHIKSVVSASEWNSFLEGAKAAQLESQL